MFLEECTNVGDRAEAFKCGPWPNLFDLVAKLKGGCTTSTVICFDLSQTKFFSAFQCVIYLCNKCVSYAICFICCLVITCITFMHCCYCGLMCEGVPWFNWSIIIYNPYSIVNKFTKDKRYLLQFLESRSM